LTFGHSVPECQKIKNGGLEQYGAECFGRLILPQSEENMALKGLITAAQIITAAHTVRDL